MTKKQSYEISKPFVSHICEHSLPKSSDITHCWHIFDFKHLGLVKIRSQAHYKAAEIWNMFLSEQKCFVSHLLFNDACGLLNLVSLQTCTTWLKFKRICLCKGKNRCISFQKQKSSLKKYMLLYSAVIRYKLPSN